MSSYKAIYALIVAAAIVEDPGISQRILRVALQLNDPDNLLPTPKQPFGPDEENPDLIWLWDESDEADWVPTEIQFPNRVPRSSPGTVMFPQREQLAR